MGRIQREKDRQRKRESRVNVAMNHLLNTVDDENTELTDDVINAAMNMLKAHSPLDSDLCICYYSPAEIHLYMNDPTCVLERQIPLDKNCLLIHPLQGHWVTSLYKKECQRVFVYDSLKSEHHVSEIFEQIKVIYGENKAFNLAYVNVQQQNHQPVCGAMAVAFAVSIFLGEDPSIMKYDVSRARSHLRAILSSGTVQPFPVIHDLLESTQTEVIHEPTFIKCKTDSMLTTYFDDQSKKNTEKKIKKGGDISLLLSSKKECVTGKYNKELVKDDNIIIQNDLSYENKRMNDRARKKKQRQDTLKREKERERDRIYHLEARKQSSIRTKEQVKEKMYKQAMRRDPKVRHKEQLKEKEYRQTVRKNPKVRHKEQIKEKEYKQTVRKNPNVRHKEQIKEKEYRQTVRKDPKVRHKEQLKDMKYRQTVRKDPKVRHKEQLKDMNYRQTVRKDPTVRHKEQLKDINYRQTVRKDPKVRHKEQLKDMNYRQIVRKDPKVRHKEQLKEKEYRQTVRKDPKVRHKEQLKDMKYRQIVRKDPKVRHKEQLKEKEYRQIVRKDPKVRHKEQLKEKEYRQIVRKDPKVRHKEQLKEKEYRKTVRKDPKVRHKEQLKEKGYRQTVRKDPKVRHKEQLKDMKYRQTVRKDPIVRHKEKIEQKIYMRIRRKNKDVQSIFRMKQCLYRNKLKNNLKEDENVITRFHTACKKMPVHTCVVCLRVLFRKQVKVLKLQRYSNEPKNVIQTCLELSGLHQPLSNCSYHCSECAKWICLNCDAKLSNEKIPNQALTNNLDVKPHPECLQNLNQLEKHLVSPVIPFMKIIPLPKGQQKGVHGPVVCVPADVSSTCETLPRQISDDTLIKVKLKRKLQYQGHHLFQQVSIRKLEEALMYLKESNPIYSGIKVDLRNIDIETEPGLVVSDGQTLTQPTDEALLDTEPMTDTRPTCDASNKQHETGIKVDLRNIDIETEPGLVVSDGQTLTQPTDEALLDTEPMTDTRPTCDASNKQHETVSDVTETSAPMMSCLQPEYPQQSTQSQQCPDDHIAVAPAEGHKPCSVYQEMKAFPFLFPEGQHGFQDERNIKLGLGRYFNSRLFSKDIRFANDPQYIFFCQYIYEVNNINSSTSIAVRKGATKSIDGTKLTAGMITDDSLRSRLLNTDKGYQFLKTVRGSPAYWEKSLRDLFAMVKQLGVPTWFCSFSAADRRWPEILEAICHQQGIPVPENPDWTEYCHLINSNPVTACRMFENRVLSFISNVIRSPANPIGKVVDFFYRTEFQSRGWPHIHCLFWCDDSPMFNSSEPNKEDFICYVDKYITCTLPDKDEDSEMYELVNSLQMHSKNHSKSCKRGSKVCRFNFPRPISTRTFIATPTVPAENVLESDYKKSATKILASVWEAIETLENSEMNTAEEVLNSINLTQTVYEKSHSALSSRNTVIFKRNIQDMWVNPYNETLLKAWNANMDIQPVLDAYSCIMYIVSYISKAERELGDLLKKAQEEAEEGHLEPIKQLRKLGNVYLHSREISIMEAIYRVCGMNLKQSSREVIFVPASQSSCRLTKPMEALKQVDGLSDDIWMTNIVDRYLSRPQSPEFDNMCLADFASNYRVTERKGETNGTESQTTACKVYRLLNNKGSIVKRQKSAVIRHTRHNKDKHPEEYFYSLMSLYYPYRQRDFKPTDIDTFEKMFHLFSDVVLPNMEPYEKLSEELNEAWQKLQEGVDPADVWANIVSNQEVDNIEDREELDQIRREVLKDTEEIDPDDIPDLSVNDTTSCNPSLAQQARRPSTNDHLQMVRSLNQAQLKLFMFIKKWAERKEHGDADPFHIFLTGGAGTGKSHTIRCILNEVDRTITRKSENAEAPVVLMVAYTGTAAYNINGQTIHSAFTINNSQVLGEESANTLRSRLQDLQLLIIDEVSMVSSELLNKIHCRLQQIKRPSKTNTFFGNVAILAVGDFFQVPPIYGKSLISVNNTLTDLWSLFSQWTLTDVVRQKGDTEFIELLNRVRIKPRNEQLRDNDLTFLQSRVVSKKSPDYPVGVLHIASTHKQLDIINERHLEELSATQTVIHIKAADLCHDRKTQKTYKKIEPLEPKGRSIPVLQPILSLCVGARVMLKQNLDVSDGLTNGVIGTVTAIIKGQMALGLPSAICVLFDHPKIGASSRTKTKAPPGVNEMSTVIKPQTEIIQKTPQVTRRQFPFMLAWAVTIHKTQGLTTDRAVVSLKGVFKAGMAYVALSRVTSGNGLYLLDTDFDTSVIYCDNNVCKQLAAMPGAETLPEWKDVHSADEVTPTPENLIIASHNCEGYYPHFHDIAGNNFLLKTDIIALQETWTSADMHIQSALPNYTVEIRHRCRTDVNNNKGGVALLIHQDLDYSLLDTSAVSIECIGVIVSSPPLTVLNVYRPPNFSLTTFCEQLQCLLHTVKTSTVIVSGDFNVNFLNPSSTRLRELFSQYQQVVTSPTTRRRTLLDHIYVRNAIVTSSGVNPTYYSFHDVTYVSIKY